MTTTAPNPVATAFQNLVNQLVGDVLSVAKPTLTKLGSDLQAASDPVSALNAILLAEATLALSAPQLEKMSINQAGAAISAFAAALPG